ncbi:hypothetical protein B0T18DRAFT_417974 [Schizothecium vesticola]|uniref:Uncharacterized protein n=1 Tax=Schizothecium vesticola TaxID=314040 RepID=A0AA40JYY0_9PEZI|nr:hypothetical protein B0T18DRAFT_417974 [Schizothecium vesticola]
MPSCRLMCSRTERPVLGRLESGLSTRDSSYRRCLCVLNRATHISTSSSLSPAPSTKPSKCPNTPSIALNAPANLPTTSSRPQSVFPPSSSPSPLPGTAPKTIKPPNNNSHLLPNPSPRSATSPSNHLPTIPACTPTNPRKYLLLPPSNPSNHARKAPHPSCATTRDRSKTSQITTIPSPSKSAASSALRIPGSCASCPIPAAPAQTAYTLSRSLGVTYPGKTACSPGGMYTTFLPPVSAQARRIFPPCR